MEGQNFKKNLLLSPPHQDIYGHSLNNNYFLMISWKFVLSFLLTGGGPQPPFNKVYEAVLEALAPEARDGIQGQCSEANPQGGEDLESSQSSQESQVICSLQTFNQKLKMHENINYNFIYVVLYGTHSASHLYIIFKSITIMNTSKLKWLKVLKLTNNNRILQILDFWIYIIVSSS